MRDEGSAADISSAAEWSAHRDEDFQRSIFVGQVGNLPPIVKSATEVSNTFFRLDNLLVPGTSRLTIGGRLPTCPTNCTREQLIGCGVYIDVFEQSILINHGSNKPWSFFASVSAELVGVSLMILIPLAYTDHLPEFHWKSVTVAPSPRPIQPIPATSQASGSFTQTIYSHPTKIFNPVEPKSHVAAAPTAPSTIDLPPGFLPTGGQGGVSMPISELVGRTTAVPPYKPPVIDKPKPAPGPMRVSEGVQMAKLINRVIPLYPPLAKSAHISGVVHLIGIISKDGTIRNLQVISGHPLLTKAAVDAVSQWVYKPTLLNNEAVEVIAPIDVNFTLSQ